MYVHHKRQKRARNKKKSAVYNNDTLIPDAKVIKETRRHVRPTLLPEPGGKYNTGSQLQKPQGWNFQLTYLTVVSPKCPEGFHLIICTPPPSAHSPSRTTSASPETQNILFGPTSTVSSLPWPGFAIALRESMSILILSLHAFT